MKKENVMIPFDTTMCLLNNRMFYVPFVLVLFIKYTSLDQIPRKSVSSEPITIFPASARTGLFSKRCIF